MKVRGIAARAFWLSIEVVEIALRLTLAIARAASTTLTLTSHFVKAQRALRGGTLHCPIGHEVPTEAETYECEACGFVYGGHRASIWVCGNPECGAITPYVDCPTCGLSCRNPYRWG